MSHREHHRLGRRRRRLCAGCCERVAKSLYKDAASGSRSECLIESAPLSQPTAREERKGQVRPDREHVLCFQCFRSERERQRARQMALFPRAPPARYQMTTPSAGPCYTGPARSKNAHRRRMLEHLEEQARNAAGRRA